MNVPVGSASKALRTTAWKTRHLRVQIQPLGVCYLCRPYLIDATSEGVYDDTFQSHCSCLKGFVGFPESIHSLRKVEIFYALYKENNDSFPKKYYHGLSKGLSLYENHLLRTNMAAPHCVSSSFLTSMDFTVVHAFSKDGTVFFHCKNKKNSCELKLSDLLHNVSEDLREQSFAYKKRFHGIDVNHPLVGAVVQLPVPDVALYSQFVDRLRNHLKTYNAYQHPSVPRYFLLQEASFYERTNNCRMCLIDCIFDTWFVRCHNDFVHEPFFLSLDEFIGLQNNKCGVSRKRFSKIINSPERREQFKSFILSTKMHKERNPYYDRNKNLHSSFCIPEDGHVFEDFLDRCNINLVPDYNCVVN